MDAVSGFSIDGLRAEVAAPRSPEYPQATSSWALRGRRGELYLASRFPMGGFENHRNRSQPAQPCRGGRGTVAKENPTSLGPLDPEIWAIEVWPIWPPAVKPSF
ncbi:hypothetical protein ACJJTC_016594 [Scirpophaga incertulas]